MLIFKYLLIAVLLAYAEASRAQQIDSSIELIPELNGPVYSIATWDTDIYVAGSFNLAGSVPVANIARWDGHSWHDLSGGLSAIDGPKVNTIIVDSQGGLYAGGAFERAGNIPVSNVAHWDGQAWTTLGDGVKGTVNALLLHHDTLFCAGDFSLAGKDSASDFAMWTGAWFTPLKGKFDKPIKAIEYKTELLLAGEFQSYDGDTSLRTLISLQGDKLLPRIRSDLKGAVYAFATANDLWPGDYAPVGGEFQYGYQSQNICDAVMASGYNINGLESETADKPVYSVCSLNESQFAIGGQFGLLGQRPFGKIALWDGAGWVKAPIESSRPVYAIVNWHNTFLYAAGVGSQRYKLHSVWLDTNISYSVSMVPLLMSDSALKVRIELLNDTGSTSPLHFHFSPAGVGFTNIDLNESYLGPGQPTALLESAQIYPPNPMLGSVILFTNALSRRHAVILVPHQLATVERRDALEIKIPVYPNPAKSKFNILLESHSGVAHLQLLAPSGMILRDEDLRLVDGQNTLTIDARDLSAGNYLFRLTASGMVYEGKVEVRR